MSEDLESDLLASPLAAMKGVVEDIAGHGSKLVETESVVQAFQRRHEELEKERWRAAVREAANNMLLIMPELNIKTWEADIGQATEKKGWLGMKKFLYKPKLVDMYPLAYLENKRIDSTRTVRDPRDGNHMHLGGVSMLLMDENGELWEGTCAVAWMNATHKVYLEDSPGQEALSLVKSKAEMLQRGRNGEIQVAILGTPAIKPWDRGEKAGLGVDTYEMILRRIGGLLQKHQEWLRTKNTQVKNALQQADSPELSDLAKLPKIR